MSSDISKIYKTIEFMKEHLEDDILIEELSKEAGLSTSHYINKFRQITGYTPSELIRKMRLERSTQSLLEQERILDVAVDNSYGSNEAYSRAFRKEFGVSPADYKKANVLCSIEELNDIEKLVVYMPAPIHEEYFGHLYYQEHKEVYDSLAEKGFFDKKTMGYRTEAKQLTEKYSYDFEYLILHTMNKVDNLADLYDCIVKVKHIPRLLFYFFLREMALNGMLNDTKFEQYKFCSDCDCCIATLGDAEFIRRKIIADYAKRGININSEDIYCLGYSSGNYSKYCPYGNGLS